MAFLTDTYAVAPQRSTFWASFAKGFEVYLDRRSRRAQVEYLQARTDAELQDLGIRRDRIVQYVFRDMLTM